MLLLNLGVDVLGPQGQPHFESDFVVRISAAFILPSCILVHCDSPRSQMPSSGTYKLLQLATDPLSRGEVKLNGQPS